MSHDGHFKGSREVEKHEDGVEALEFGSEVVISYLAETSFIGRNGTQIARALREKLEARKSRQRQ